jgi:hypothetical protein
LIAHIWKEIEFNGSANFSGDIVGAILENPTFADSDPNRCSCLRIDSRGRDGKTQKSICELHYDIYNLMPIEGD